MNNIQVSRIECRYQSDIWFEEHKLLKFSRNLEELMK